MLRQFTLQPNEDKRLQVEGRYLVVTQATGPIELSIGGTLPIVVDEKDRIHMRGDSPNSRALRIKNISGGVNDIELHTSDLLVDKRTSIQVENSIAIDADQIVGIDPGANIVQAVVQNPIRLDPSENVIRIDPASNDVDATIQNAVRIDANENTVKIADSQRIGIDPNLNDVDATIQNAVRIDPNENTVKMAGGQSIGIDENQNTVRLADGVTVSIDPMEKPPLRFQMMATINITDEFVNPIERHDPRVQLILTAAQSNVDPVWISDEPERGVPIWPGERVTLNTEQRLTIVGTPGDKCYVAEIVINSL